MYPIPPTNPTAVRTTSNVATTRGTLNRSSHATGGVKRNVSRMASAIGINTSRAKYRPDTMMQIDARRVNRELLATSTGRATLALSVSRRRQLESQIDALSQELSKQM